MNIDIRLNSFNFLFIIKAKLSKSTYKTNHKINYFKNIYDMIIYQLHFNWGLINFLRLNLVSRQHPHWPIVRCNK